MAEEKKDVDVKEIVNSYLQDEKVTQNLLTWAKHFADKFHNNAFTIAQVIKKTPLKEEGAVRDILQMLVLKGFAFSNVVKNELKFKITLKPADRLRMLKMHLASIQQSKIELEEKEAFVQKEIKRLEDQIGNPKNK